MRFSAPSIALLAGLMATSLAPPPVTAQAPTPALEFPDPVPQAAPEVGSVLRLTASGVGMGAAGVMIGCMGGAVAGAFVGANEPEGMGMGPGAGAVFGCFGGGPIGWLVGVPVGVHLGNDRRGSFTLDLLASGAAVVAVLAGNSLAHGAGLTNDDISRGGLLLIPVAQIGAVVWTERWRSR